MFMVVVFPGCFTFAGRPRPFCRIESRKSDIAGHVCMHLREVNPVRNGQAFLINSGAADYHDLFAAGLPSLAGCSAQRRKNSDAVCIKFWIPADNKIGPAGQWPSDGLERFPSHDDRLPHRNGFEIAKIA